jgi:2-oxoisovalerate dehydrogenase E1 component
MAKAVTASTEQSNAAYAGLEPEQLIRIYRLMYLSRRTDDREILLKRQQKIFFQISGAGSQARLRLVLPLLSRSRIVPHPG